MVIRVRDLYKVYRLGETRVKALNGVSFDIDRGVFCSVVGTSGSGKSTLLNMLAGLEPATKGTIVIAGQHIENMNESELVTFRREHVGFIFQSYNLMPTMNSVENVALPLAFRGVDKKTRTKKAEEVLELVGLEKYKKNLPSQMSGGQQQRVGIARALVLDPEIVFADEPTGNLDSNTTMEVLKLIQKISHEQNQTMVMVTHDNHLASFGDRIIHISDGKIIKIEDNRAVAEAMAAREGLGAEGDALPAEGTMETTPLPVIDVTAPGVPATDQAAAETSAAEDTPAEEEAPKIIVPEYDPMKLAENKENNKE